MTEWKHGLPPGGRTDENRKLYEWRKNTHGVMMYRKRQEIPEIQRNPKGDGEPIVIVPYNSYWRYSGKFDGWYSVCFIPLIGSLFHYRKIQIVEPV